MTQNLWAQNLSNIQIKGNARIERAALLDKISSQVGSPFSQSQVTRDVKALFDTGFFYDIKVDLSGSTLTFSVVEKPIIQKVEYLGNKALDDKELSEVSSIRANEILDIKKVNLAIKDMKKKYEEKGFFLVKVDYKISKVTPESSKLTFQVQEGDKVKIKKVNLIGNKSISTQKIKSLMATKEQGIFGMGGSFQEDALKRDQEVIGYIFRNEGFAQVQVSPANVELSRDKRGLLVTYYITEGKKYIIGEVSFSGDVDYDEEELLKDLEIDESDYFSQAILLKDISTLQAKYGDEGYAYTNVVPRPKFREEEDTIDVVFDISKGDKVTIGEINVKGNTNTRDKVVRRELRLYEGELYSETEKRKSLANVKRLGFFDNVEFQQGVSGDGADVMDIDVDVKERSTGQLNIGAGYGGYGGFTLQGSVQQANFLGKGINFGANINYSKKREQLFNLNITDPYFRDSEWTVGFDAYRAISRVISYDERRKGGSLTVGRRFGDFLVTSLKYKLEHVRVERTEHGFKDVFTDERIDSATGYSSSLTASLAYDKRNDRQFPTKGYYGRLSLEQAGIFGDLNYTKARLNLRYYKPLIGSLVLRNKLEYGWVGSTRPEVPLNELFRLGSPDTIRGFDFFSIAQRLYSADALNTAIAQNKPYPFERAHIPYGGVQQLYYNLELEWGLVKEAGIKGVIFVDTGTANDAIDLGELKSSYGFGIRWHSPMGPLRFEWAFPFDPDETLGERKSDFQFSIMQSF